MSPAHTLVLECFDEDTDVGGVLNPEDQLWKGWYYLWLTDQIFLIR